MLFFCIRVIKPQGDSGDDGTYDKGKQSNDQQYAFLQRTVPGFLHNKVLSGTAYTVAFGIYFSIFPAL